MTIKIRICSAAVLGLAACCVSLLLPLLLLAQSPELIVDIITAPNRYWNKSVTLTGHVRSVAANPPGTNRGTYVLRDSSASDITVLTEELPPLGNIFRVIGVVERINPDQRTPCLREKNRLPASAQVPAPTTPQSEVREVRETPKKPAPERIEPPKAPAPAARPAAEPAPPPVTRDVQPQPVIVQVPEPSQPVYLSPLFISLVAVALLLILILVYLLRPKAAPAPAVVMQQAPPAPVAAPPPRVMQAVATDVYQPRPPVMPASKATEVFVALGAEIEVLEGPDRGRRFQITKPNVTIGRPGERQNDVSLTDSTISREHAKIIYSTAEKSFLLINESRTNPVRLNEEPRETAHLQDGDVIKLGATALRFRKSRT